MNSANAQRQPIAVIGGGPAGSTAALCLRKLGRRVVVFEREHFPRYHIGESLLPGTMSILQRLGVYERIEAAGFVKKRAATFLWGDNRPPWSFTFATPRSAPWVFDHGFQVDRAEYDAILLDAARDAGAEVREACEVTAIDRDGRKESPILSWKNGDGSGKLEAEYVIDASGCRALTASAKEDRRRDEYFRNIALWSYFKGGKRFKGALEGNIFSVAFKNGWIWMIPLKGDRYSVGVVTGVESKHALAELGKEDFYRQSLASCPFAAEVLETATSCDGVHAMQEWSYQSIVMASGRVFRCGDAACFIDPLFSQGVHLATYSAMLAAAAIDRLLDSTSDADAIRAWFDAAYRAAYNRYHKFLVAFYADNHEHDSRFWSNRKIRGAGDTRFEAVDWFSSMTGQHVETGAQGIEELEEGVGTLARLWSHGSNELTDQFDDQELSLRRLRWAGEILKELRGLSAIRWASDRAVLVRTFRVDPTSFKLHDQWVLGDGNGRTERVYPANEDLRQLMENLARESMDFRELSRKLTDVGAPASPLQYVVRLIEEGFLKCYDAEGRPHRLTRALRFGGVGADDDLS